MTLATEAPGAKKLRFKMRLHNNEYLAEYGGHLDAGSVVIVDEDTAIRWLERGIARQAGRDEKTASEERREKLRAQLQSSAVEDADEPSTVRPALRQPKPRTSRKATLSRDDVVNAADDDGAFGADTGDE